ncbi:beta-lactamase domain-containing protein 2-like [Littorina saxatilis]|uniref:Beta-lactamase-related domain-containing protein n=1 Tax=Littorina saxatilis TaxID=31220 RepID=A0AAN9BQ48_9CAEN
MGAVSVLLKLAAAAVVVSIGVRVFLSRKQLPPATEGFFLPQYRPVAELFRKFVVDGTERGGSFAVYHKGEPLVDLWGGYADPDSQRPWREDTVTMVWSCTKGASALAIAVLVDRGLLDYKAEVWKYWPEFAQNSKSNITVEMVMSHSAGLLSLGGQSITLEEYKNDWKKVEQLMAAAPPDFPPGRRVAYHAFTLAMYADALVRRVDPQHRNLSRFFQEEIAIPFGIDFHIGLPLHQYYRSARQFFVPGWSSLALLFDSEHRAFAWLMMTQPDGLFSKAVKVIRRLQPEMEIVNDPIYMEIGMGSIFGFAAARAPAKMYSILANGGKIGDKKLLSKPLADSLSVPLTQSLPQEIEALNLVFSRGFQVNKNHRGDLMFGHDGYGGQQSRADPKNNLGIAYTTNFHWAKNLRPVDHYLELERVFYECFDEDKGKTVR